MRLLEHSCQLSGKRGGTRCFMKESMSSCRDSNTFPAMAHTSLRFAIVLATLLSLSCSAIAGRHLLQTSNTRYQAMARVASKFRTMPGESSLYAEVTAKFQNISFDFHFEGLAPKAYATLPAFYESATGYYVAGIPCHVTIDRVKGTWNCTGSQSTALTTPYKPVGSFRFLVDAGPFNNPSAFYVGVTVDQAIVAGVTFTDLLVKGTVGAIAAATKDSLLKSSLCDGMPPKAPITRGRFQVIEGDQSDSDIDAAAAAGVIVVDRFLVKDDAERHAGLKASRQGKLPSRFTFEPADDPGGPAKPYSGQIQPAPGTPSPHESTGGGGFTVHRGPGGTTGRFTEVREGRGREEGGREEKWGVERVREERVRDGSWEDKEREKGKEERERRRDERSKVDRGREEKGKEERGREERAREERVREERLRGERGKEARPREEKPGPREGGVFAREVGKLKEERAREERAREERLREERAREKRREERSKEGGGSRELKGREEKGKEERGGVGGGRRRGGGGGEEAEGLGEGQEEEVSNSGRASRRAAEGAVLSNDRRLGRRGRREWAWRPLCCAAPSCPAQLVSSSLLLLEGRVLPPNRPPTPSHGVPAAAAAAAAAAGSSHLPFFQKGW
ncbi:unnamed protein product [Closterium sp. Yama58-4]|nr:unnamed protein product [Closterium sp. Yama58-4]